MFLPSSIFNFITLEEKLCSPHLQILKGTSYQRVFVKQSVCVDLILTDTVPTFNSFIKGLASPGIINDHMPGCYPVSLAWMYG